MSDLRCLVYASSAIGRLAPDKLENLARQARAHNRMHALTGVLLHADGNFMQYLEGPADALAEAYRRILHDPRHHQVIVLLDEDIVVREFPGWPLAFIPAQTTSPPKFNTTRWGLAPQSWDDPVRPELQVHSPHGEAHELMRNFWRITQSAGF